jgi:hypothetical protein
MMLEKKDFLLLIDSAKEGIFTIPIFHHSMSGAEFQVPINTPKFNKFWKFRDVYSL